MSNEKPMGIAAKEPHVRYSAAYPTGRERIVEGCIKLFELLFCGRIAVKSSAWVLLVVLSLSGCMTAKLSGLERSSDPIKEEIYHGKGWHRGRSWCGCWDDEKSCDRTLGSVQVKYNYLYALAAVLSFGIYMPIEIDYRLNPKNVEGQSSE